MMTEIICEDKEKLQERQDAGREHMKMERSKDVTNRGLWANNVLVGRTATKGGKPLTRRSCAISFFQPHAGGDRTGPGEWTRGKGGVWAVHVLLAGCASACFTFWPEK